MRSRTIALLLAMIVGATVSACDRGDRIVVGAKAFTEGYLFGHMIAILLEDAGYSVDEQFGLASAAMRGAIETGQVDIYVEYTGTAYAVYARGEDRGVMVDSARVLDAVRRFDSVERDLSWLTPFPFENTYALVTRKGRDLESFQGSLSGLARSIRNGTEATIAVDAEFFERVDGMKGLADHYDLPLRNVRKMDAGLIYDGVRTDAIDVGMGYSTDGRIAAFDLAILDDDRRFFPAYHPAAVVRRELLLRHPGIRIIIERLNSVLDATVMRKLNGLVDMHHRDPRKVAREFLLRSGVLTQRPTGSRPSRPREEHQDP